MRAERDPNEHLARMQAALAGRRAKSVFASYAAAYRALAAAPRRPLRATYLVVGAGSEGELRRVAELVRRVAEERGVELRELPASELVELWSSAARAGSEHHLGIHTATGDGLLAALHFGRRWPSQVPPGWLAGLLAAPGLAAVSMRVRPLSRAEAMSFMTARLRHVRAGERLAAERGEVEDPERERIGATAVAARRATQAGQGRIYFADTVLLLGAPDRATLQERIEALRLEARSQQLEVELASFRIGQAWQNALPGPQRRPLAERNLDTTSLAASLLHTSADLYEASGHLYGVQRNSGAPIVLDRFARPSHNAIVLGMTGTGKTMFTGAEMGRCFLRGVRVLAVDPLGDYRRLAAELGGTYLDLGAPGVGLNPFALTAAGNPGTFAAKLAMLTRLVAAMAGGLTRDERPALDRALRASYEAAGIGPDPASFGRPAPILADLADHLAEQPGGAALARRLERWATGSLADVLGRQAEVPLDRRMLVIGLSAIGDPEVRAVAQFAALSVLWDAVRRDKAPKLVVVDEAWKVMRQPSGAEFIEELARSARHYHAGLQLSTQDIIEFVRSEVGEPIVKQCDLRVLLGQTPEAADALTRYFDLTTAERRALLHAGPGEGLLFVGHSHAAFSAIVSKREYAILTTRPADLTQTEMQRANPESSVRRGGCGCLGCGALLFVTLAILTGSVGVLAGDWGGLTAPRRPEPAAAVADIPTEYLALYSDAGRRFGLDWPVLAAVGRVESDHGRLTAACIPNEAGAIGPMQFLPASFAQAAEWAGSGRRDICDPVDAIPAAAAYLRHFGAPDDWRRALYAYNHRPPTSTSSWPGPPATGTPPPWSGRSTGRSPSASARPTSSSSRRCGTRPVVRALPRRARHRRAGRHAGRGHRRRGGDLRRADRRRGGGGRARARPRRDFRLRAISSPTRRFARASRSWPVRPSAPSA